MHPSTTRISCGIAGLVPVEVECVEQEVVQGLPRQWCGERCGREIVEVVCDDHVGTACSCSRDHVPVIWIGQLDGLD
jgi:hypothetical protein